MKGGSIIAVVLLILGTLFVVAAYRNRVEQLFAALK